MTMMIIVMMVIVMMIIIVVTMMIIVMTDGDDALMIDQTGWPFGCLRNLNLKLFTCRFLASFFWGRMNLFTLLITDKCVNICFDC